MKKILIFLIIVVCLSCEKNDKIEDIDPTEPNYPTTINRIDSNLLAQMRYEYHQTNYFVLTSLNQFGFCDCCADFGSSYGDDPPPVLSDVSESYAKKIVRDFLVLNEKYTGISSIDNFCYLNENYEKIGSNIFWNFGLTNQIYDSLEVIYTQISIEVENGKVTWCTGNWYPEIYIPEDINYTEEYVRSLFVDTVLCNSDCWGGLWCDTVTNKILDESIIRKVIFPIETNSKIELRVSWEIDIPNPIFYKFYIDVITGEIIHKEPTIF